MIAVVDVAVQAANVSMPLFPWRAFRNSYSSVRVRNVPRKIGKWNITNVSVQVTYPDGSIKTADAVLTGGVWVATLEGTATAGTSLQGYKILASGIDENGQSVSNYCLGRGDVTILEDDGELIPENVTTYTRLLSSEPTQPKEGDLWPLSSGGYVIYQNGQANTLGLTEDDLSAYATKTIEETVTYTYELPREWYDANIGTTLFFTNIHGSKITWSESSTKLTYDVETHELAYTSYNGKSFSFGEYTSEDIQQHMQDYMPFEYYDEETDTHYSVQPYTPENYDFDITITKDVMYAEGGASVLSTKQDALDANQMSAVNSGITSEKVAAYDALLSSQVELAQDITYSELYQLFGSNQLQPGKTYCITDYKATTVQTDTSSDNKVAPIVVRAATASELQPYGYMPSLKCEIKYSLQNDQDRFAWADTTNGKGVIYWMRDKYGNECPYDFKHILFKPYDPRTNPITAQRYYYTFWNYNVSNIREASETGTAFNNIILPTYGAVSGTSVSNAQKLNNIVINASSGARSYSNYFGPGCYSIFCLNGALVRNQFENACSRIYMSGNATGNVFVNDNTLAIGSMFNYNIFEPAISNITIGNSADDLKAYFYYNKFCGPILRLKITTSQTTSSNNQIRGNTFCKYLAYVPSGGGTAEPDVLNIDIVGQSYEVEYKRNGSKTITFN